ncbi:MAG: hypothetical protein LZ158_04875 [Thaumarchaeota archaeon]|jgi:uncharacterized protein with PQ loop repeat|nr:hypothetical protein [Candidatus Terraquivivens yellowstonensis]MCL7387955.1 hypothetical protein [Candidatus Terraquivivens yellowstonensis]MCL7392523.1 hypothetical protein [Candidatus Terraquivivens yellowstonensis]MCL7394624.1 hypothetical protein [Candidatus Terraquivivens yellowstonensis]MCL7398192.1 hypothetical protein [Candidatus Terraquivivens yellowstonensis]
MILEDKLYWSKVFLGIFIGFLSALLRLHEPTSMVAITVAITVYVVYSIISPLIFRAQRGYLKTKKPYITGLTTYFLVWLVSWILFYNIILR